MLIFHSYVKALEKEGGQGLENRREVRKGRHGEREERRRTRGQKGRGPGGLGLGGKARTISTAKRKKCHPKDPGCREEGCFLSGDGAVGKGVSHKSVLCTTCPSEKGARVPRVGMVTGLGVNLMGLTSQSGALHSMRHHQCLGNCWSWSSSCRLLRV